MCRLTENYISCTELQAMHLLSAERNPCILIVADIFHFYSGCSPAVLSDIQIILLSSDHARAGITFFNCHAAEKNKAARLPVS